MIGRWLVHECNFDETPLSILCASHTFAICKIAQLPKAENIIGEQQLNSEKRAKENFSSNVTCIKV